MKSFVKGLWSRTKKRSHDRTLDHPRDLLGGDMIEIDDSFALPPLIRGKIFHVTATTTYQFEHDFSTNFSLEGERHEQLDLLIEREDGQDFMAMSFRVIRTQVEKIFNMDQFAGLFESDGSAVLERIGEPAELEGWTAPLYRQSAQAQRGFYYETDYRESKPPDEEGQGEPFEYYAAVSDDGNYAIEVEVWEGGETDVSLTIYRPISDIRELWPGEISVK